MKKVIKDQLSVSTRSNHRTVGCVTVSQHRQFRLKIRINSRRARRYAKIAVQNHPFRAGVPAWRDHRCPTSTIHLEVRGAKRGCRCPLIWPKVNTRLNVPTWSRPCNLDNLHPTVFPQTHKINPTFVILLVMRQHCLWVFKLAKIFNGW